MRAGRVALFDLNETWLEQSTAEMRGIGGKDRALPVRVNITDPSDIERAINQTISALGGLHILVNNAGINQRSEGFTTSDRRTIPGSSRRNNGTAWSRSNLTARFTCLERS